VLITTSGAVHSSGVVKSAPGAVCPAILIAVVAPPSCAPWFISTAVDKSLSSVQLVPS
jgi:hypothetical protein